MYTLRLNVSHAGSERCIELGPCRNGNSLRVSFEVHHLVRVMPRPNRASLAGESNTVVTVCVLVPWTVVAASDLLSSAKMTFPVKSVKVTTPLVVLTLAFIRAVVIVTVLAASATQKLGVGQWR